MSTIHHRLALLAACAGLACAAAQAQTDPKAELRAAVARALTPFMPNDAGDVVRRLQQVKPDGAISTRFDIGKVSAQVFGRAGAVSAPDCRVAVTPQREPDEGLCLYEQGKRDDETGAYAALQFSKNIGQGNVRFMRRAAFQPGGGAEPPPVKLTDAEAYQKATAFAELLGIPRGEIPVAPAGVKNPLQVRTLLVGAGEDRGLVQKVALQKVVTLPRAFVVPGGLYRDPTTGVIVNHVPAPGVATFAVTDAGVQFARVDGWSDAQFDPRVASSKVKNVGELASEIADDLYNEGVRRVGTLSAHVVFRRAYPNPDDPNPPLCPVCGWLLPAVKVSISQLGAGRGQTSQGSFAAPGIVREYDLVDAAERAPR